VAQIENNLVFGGFEQYKKGLEIENQLLCTDVQPQVSASYDLKNTSKFFQRNQYRWHCNYLQKKAKYASNEH